MASIAQALAKRSVQTVPIDPTTGLPVSAVARELAYYPQATARPVQTTKRARGDYPPAYNSLSEPWPGAYDQTVAQNGRVVDKYTVASNPPSQFSQGYVDTMGAPGANTGTGPRMATDAQQAIAEILVRGGNKPQMQGPPLPPAGWSSAASGMAWEPAVSVGTAPQGDPWARDRIDAQTMNGTPPTQGLVTGPTSRAATLHQQLSASPEQQRIAALSWKKLLNKEAAERALAIDMAGGSTHQQGKYGGWGSKKAFQANLKAGLKELRR